VNRKVVVIGGGFSGLSAACYLAKYGYQVTLIEKHETLGGRARQWKVNGYLFDMGPSWYWMPDIFERFFGDFNRKVSEFYVLQILDPGFRMFFAEDELDIPYQRQALGQLFESIEPGASLQLDKFLKSAAFKYRVGMHDLVYKPGLSWTEFLDVEVIRGFFRLNLITPFDRYVGRHFKDPRLQQLMEFPVLFLGASPAKTPALYSLMNYAGLALGTWYPQGGMYEIVRAMTTVATGLGVEMVTGQSCLHIDASGDSVRSVTTADQQIPADYVVSSADYHFTEQQLLPREFRNYNEQYWQSRTMAPSSLIFYLGVKGRIDKLLHHNLFFDEDLRQHTREIYEDPQWPTKPLFYVCCPSKTDQTVAPDQCENLFILMPLAAGLNDTAEIREQYFQIIIKRLEKRTGEKIEGRIEQKHSYCLQNFVDDYGASKGNAYGLANTLKQTAILKPSIKNKRLKNLYYTGHLTVPGPGVPPSLISGKLVADQILKEHHL
jgi:phytoene desaturase